MINITNTISIDEKQIDLVQVKDKKILTIWLKNWPHHFAVSSINDEFRTFLKQNKHLLCECKK